MDNKLKQLFGYQRFAENRDLQQVIDRASDAASNGISGLDSGE